MIVVCIGTGRCGTKTMQRFFQYQGWPSYHHRNNQQMMEDFFRAQHVKGRFLADVARREYDEMKRLSVGGNYFEANGHLSSFIGELYKIDNSIKFVYLIRKMAEFVESGIFRQWYKTGSKYDRFRWRPPDHIVDQRGKIEWLWGAINSEISTILQTIPLDSYGMYGTDDMPAGIVEADLSALLGIEFKPGYDWKERHNANSLPNRYV